MQINGLLRVSWAALFFSEVQRNVKLIFTCCLPPLGAHVHAILAKGTKSAASHGLLFQGQPTNRTQPSSAWQPVKLCSFPCCLPAGPPGKSSPDCPRPRGSRPSAGTGHLPRHGELHLDLVRHQDAHDGAVHALFKAAQTERKSRG